jgi:mono/diheme cytochrome c family protein
MKIGLFACLLSVIVSPMLAMGQCRTVRTVGGGSVVVQSAPCGTHLQAVPVQQAYVENYNYQRVVAVPVQVQPDYVFSVNDALRDKILSDAIVGRLTPILLQQQQNQLLLQAQIQQLAGGSPIPLSDPGALQLPPVRKIESPRMGSTSPQIQDAAAKPSVGYQAKPEAQKIFNERCTRCHGDNGIVKGGFNMKDTGKLSLEDWQSIYITSNTGDMPKDDKALTDAEVRVILQEYKSAKAASRK